MQCANQPGSKSDWSSAGGHHRVSLTTIYVPGSDSEDEAVAAAQRILKEEWCVSRSKNAADGCLVAGTKSKPFQLGGGRCLRDAP